MDGIDLNNASLYVIEAPGSDPRHLGSFENASFLSWSAGWTHILMTSGPWDNSQIFFDISSFCVVGRHKASPYGF